MGIFDWWHGRSGSTPTAQLKQQIDETVERVVQTTNPRLRFAPHYRAQLAPAVEISLAYARDLVASLPPAREASVATWSRDPFMRAFFASADDLARTFSRAPDLRAYFEQNPAMSEAYATLGMEMTERKILGMALEGTLVQRDVAQTTVSFGDYRIRICGRTEPELRAALERRIMDQLALEGLIHISADASRRTTLKNERALIKTRLKLLERQGMGMRAALGGEDVGQEELARLQLQLEENTRNLDGLGDGAQMLDFELEHICSVLAEPAKHIYLSSKRLQLDRMNVVIADSNTQDGNELEFLILRVPGTNPPLMRVGTLVRFPRAELLPTNQSFAEAARLLM